jgi:7,8-dihydropterin-6-yl-methyl-4-(beta-D-ribofuranosyl)aminobenzene 5'-phosphate synthase
MPLHEAKALEEGTAPDAPLAEHGFSVLVEVHKGDTTRRVLFDTGLTPQGCVNNLHRLGWDPGDLEVIVCSHGHFDHTTGCPGSSTSSAPPACRSSPNPEFWNHRRLAIPGAEPFELPTTSRRALEDAGFDIIENRQPSFLFGRSVVVTREVDRTSGFEQGFPIHQARRNGSWEPDPLILDDQALIANVAGKGLVVITGCGHAGVINTCRYAQRLSGVDQLHAVIGGFHLNGPLFAPPAWRSTAGCGSSPSMGRRGCAGRPSSGRTAFCGCSPRSSVSSAGASPRPSGAD